MTIQTIPLEPALDIRHAVLWPDHPRDFSRVQGDEGALHLGIYEKDQLICVASLYETREGLRLRKFATLPEYQGKGHGSAMMRHAIAHCETIHQPRLWLSARATAMPFYARFGFEPFGAPAEKAGVAYRYMERIIQV